MSRVLGGAELRRAVSASLDVLRSRRAAIDAANVYPVPDGDTGTNLVLTFEAVAAAVEKVAGDDAEVARAVKTGSLMGARGNSGVIMAQILRGLAEAVENGPAGVEALARGFDRAVALAYEAVLEPAEGTILTVARAAAEAARGDHPDVAAQMEAAHRAAEWALGRTPEMMPLLARAGVLDAGGMGLVAVLHAFAETLAGRDVASAPLVPVVAAAPCDGGSLTYAYEVQYLLDAPDETIPPLRQLLGTIGDSVAVIGGDGTWRVHVHTNDRERAIGFGRALGEVSSIEVSSFAEQVARADAPDAVPSLDEERPAGARGITVAHAEVAAVLVAVASGAGCRRLFQELGAIVVDGGATMNPSVGELLDAIERAPTEHVFVLPNNDNVLAAAQAAAGETSKTVRVVRTSDLGEGLAAAIAYSDGRSPEANEADMHQALERVRTGQVAVSIMSGQTPIGPVEEGQAIGFAEGRAVAIEDDPIRAAAEVARALVAPGAELLTVLCGADVDDAERARLEQTLRKVAPGVAVEVHDGGQPVQRYVLAAE